MPFNPFEHSAVPKKADEKEKLLEDTANFFKTKALAFSNTQEAKHFLTPEGKEWLAEQMADILEEDNFDTDDLADLAGICFYLLVTATKEVA